MASSGGRFAPHTGHVQREFGCRFCGIYSSEILAQPPISSAAALRSLAVLMFLPRYTGSPAANFAAASLMLFASTVVVTASVASLYFVIFVFLGSAYWASHHYVTTLHDVAATSRVFRHLFSRSETAPEQRVGANPAIASQIVPQRYRFSLARR